MTGSVDIEDLSLVTSPTAVTIHFTRGLILRAAVAGGRLLIRQNGAATVTLLTPVETLGATFEIAIAVPVITIILIDHKAVTRLIVVIIIQRGVTRLEGGCHCGD